MSRKINHLILGYLVLCLGFAATVSVIHAAEKQLPELRFYSDDELVSSRPMTAVEYQKWLALEAASQEMQKQNRPVLEMSGDINRQVLEITRIGNRMATRALYALNSSDVQEFEDDLQDTLDELTFVLEIDVAEIERRASVLEEYAEKIEQAADAFTDEIKRNSSSVSYDSIRIDENSEEIMIRTNKKSRVRPGLHMARSEGHVTRSHLRLC